MVAAIDDGSSYVICWTSDGPDGSHYGIFGKRYPSQPTILTLEPFDLLLPSVFDTLNTYQPTFTWQAANRAEKIYPWETTYDLWLDTSPNFTSPEIIKDIVDTTYSYTDYLRFDWTYYWSILAHNAIGDSLWNRRGAHAFTLSSGTKIESNTKETLYEFRLLQNYPNPFNVETRIRYSLPSGVRTQRVKLAIHDPLGRLIKVLVDEEKSTGEYLNTWNGKDNHGRPVSSGIYIYSVDYGDIKMSRKLLLLR